MRRNNVMLHIAGVYWYCKTLCHPNDLLKCNSIASTAVNHVQNTIKPTTIFWCQYLEWGLKSAKFSCSENGRFETIQTEAQIFV
jgi:hypothetical protein